MINHHKAVRLGFQTNLCKPKLGSQLGIQSASWESDLETHPDRVSTENLKNPVWESDLETHPDRVPTRNPDFLSFQLVNQNWKPNRSGVSSFWKPDLLGFQTRFGQAWVSSKEKKGERKKKKKMREEEMELTAGWWLVRPTTSVVVAGVRGCWDEVAQTGNPIDLRRSGFPVERRRKKEEEEGREEEEEEEKEGGGGEGDGDGIDPGLATGETHDQCGRRRREMVLRRVDGEGERERESGW